MGAWRLLLMTEVLVITGSLDHLALVTRGLTTEERDGRRLRVLTASRTYPAERPDVWDACTNPQRIARWFMPISGELGVGGRYQLEGNAGGEVLECDPPRSFRITWEYGGDVSWVLVRLDVVDGGTRLELEHAADVPAEMWEQYGPGATGVGWDMALLGLGLHLDSGRANDPEQALAWQASDEGREFVARSSEDWARASVEAGTDETRARAAAARTTAAYTGAAVDGETD